MSSSANHSASASARAASYPIQLASSLLPSSPSSSTSNAPLVSLKYKFRPPSVSAASLGVLHAPSSSAAPSSSTSSASVDWLLELVGDEVAAAPSAEASSSAHAFRGTGSASKDVDCVLVWDEEKQSYTLCPVPLSILLRYERKQHSLTSRGKQKLQDAKSIGEEPQLHRIDAIAAGQGEAGGLPSSSSSASNATPARKDPTIAPPQRRSSRSATKRSRESRTAFEEGEVDNVKGLGVSETEDIEPALQPPVVLKSEQVSKAPVEADAAEEEEDGNDGWGAMMASEGDAGGYGDAQDDDQRMSIPHGSASPATEMRRTRSRDESVSGVASKTNTPTAPQRRPAPIALRALAEQAAETVSTPGHLTDQVLAPAQDGSDEDEAMDRGEDADSEGKAVSNGRSGVSQSPVTRYAASIPSVAPTPAMAPTPQLGGAKKAANHRTERLDSPALSGKATPAISPASAPLPGTPGAAPGMGSTSSNQGVSTHSTWQPPPQRQPAAINYMDDYDDEDDEDEEDDDESGEDDEESDGESSMDLDAFAAQLDQALENPTPMDEHPPSSALGLPSSTSTGSMGSTGAKAQRSSKRTSVPGAAGRRSQR